MIREGMITVKYYGGLAIADYPMFSGSGGGPSGPPKPHAPVKKPGKKPKK